MSEDQEVNLKKFTKETRPYCNVSMKNEFMSPRTILVI
jgi:hypothetical protein